MIALRPQTHCWTRRCLCFWRGNSCGSCLACLNFMSVLVDQGGGDTWILSGKVRDVDSGNLAPERYSGLGGRAARVGVDRTGVDRQRTVPHAGWFVRVGARGRRAPGVGRHGDGWRAGFNGRLCQRHAIMSGKSPRRRGSGSASCKKRNLWQFWAENERLFKLDSGVAVA